MSARASVGTARSVAPSPLPTILLLTVAGILLIPLALLNGAGWILAPGVDVREPQSVARAAQLVYALAWSVPFVGTIAAALLAFRMHRSKRESLFIGVAALVLVLTGWAVSLVVPPIIMA